MMTETHYLEQELEARIRHDPAIWEFLRESSLDGVWYWDLEDPTQEWMSPEFWHLFGIDPKTKKHEASEWQELIFSEDRDTALESFQRHCADPDHPYDQIVRYRHANGSTVWVRCRGRAIRDAAGKPVRMLGVHNDITAAKEAEEEAKRNLATLEAANDDLTSFLYAISHDLTSPANSVEALLQEILLSKADALDEDGLELLGLANRSILRLQLLIRDLSRYSQVISQQPAKTHESLHDLAKLALANMEAKRLKTNAVVRIGPLASVDCYASHIVILLECLISNGMKYAKPGCDPHIQIDLARDGQNHVVFEVSDRGSGIPKAKREEVFTMFRRLHRHDEIPGTGVGLPLCRRIARCHGGDVELSDHDDGGTRVTVTLSKK